MNTTELVDFQIVDSENGLVMPWWVHGFLEELKTWDLKDKTWLEFGGGRSTAWLRSKCRWVDTIESNNEWAGQAVRDCNASLNLNGYVKAMDDNIPDGVPERMRDYFDLIPEHTKYDIISVDGIYRDHCLQWALDHFKGRGGILIADNFDQDYVWISKAAERLMQQYEAHIYVQPDHVNHEGKAWNTRYWIIPK